MKVIRAFRNLDRHGQQRAPEVIEEEVRQLEPHLVRFSEDLVRLEVVASQTRGKTRIQVSLRLQLPSGVIAAQEEGFEIEPVLRKAFADLRHQVDRHVARLKHELRRAAIITQRIHEEEVCLAHVPDVANVVDFLTKWVSLEKAEASIAYLAGTAAQPALDGAIAAIAASTDAVEAFYQTLLEALK